MYTRWSRRKIGNGTRAMAACAEGASRVRPPGTKQTRKRDACRAFQSPTAWSQHTQTDGRKNSARKARKREERDRGCGEKPAPPARGRCGVATYESGGKCSAREERWAMRKQGIARSSREKSQEKLSEKKRSLVVRRERRGASACCRRTTGLLANRTGK